MTASILARRGSLYLTCEVYERYFPGLDGVVLLQRDGDLLITPVRHAAAGGYLLKIRNRAGDRVINAVDFLRALGLPEDVDCILQGDWSHDHEALKVSLPFLQS